MPDSKIYPTRRRAIAPDPLPAADWERLARARVMWPAPVLAVNCDRAGARLAEAYAVLGLVLLDDPAGELASTAEVASRLRIPYLRAAAALAALAGTEVAR